MILHTGGNITAKITYALGGCPVRAGRWCTPEQATRTSPDREFVPARDEDPAVPSAPTALLSMLLFAGLTASAQDAGQIQPQAQNAASYQGHRVIRAVPESGERLARVLDLSHHIWSERVGRGPIDVQVDAEAFKALQAEGFELTVLVDDVAALVARERAEIEARAQQPRRGGDAIDFTNYYPLADIVTFINQLAAERPDLVSIESIGQSIQGRDIWTMTITAPGDASSRPQVALNSLIHAREWITPPATLRLARDLVRGYGIDPRLTSLLDQVQFVITPVVNPDGYFYSWQNTNNRFWRKNRRNNGDGTFGVDLNRNWDINFGGNGADPFTSSDIYHGPSAFSEPETAAMRDKLLTALPDLRSPRRHPQLQRSSFSGRPASSVRSCLARGRARKPSAPISHKPSSRPPASQYTPAARDRPLRSQRHLQRLVGRRLRHPQLTPSSCDQTGGQGLVGFSPSPSLRSCPTADRDQRRLPAPGRSHRHAAAIRAAQHRLSLQFDQPVSYDFSVLARPSMTPSSAVSVFVRQGNGAFAETCCPEPRQRPATESRSIPTDLRPRRSSSMSAALTDTAQPVTYPALRLGACPVAIPVTNQQIHRFQRFSFAS